MNAHDELIWYPTNELYHNGIKGQKWGERNGPPYPLNPSDRSAAEKKAAGGSSGSGSDSQSSKVSLKDRIFKKSSSSKSDSDDKEETEKKRSKTLSKPKSVKDMSDEELNAATKRLEKEKQYLEYQQKISELSTPKAKETTSLGKSIVNGLTDVGGSIAKKTLKDIGTQTADYVLGVEINKLLTKFNEKNGIDDTASINPKSVQERKPNNYSSPKNNQTSNSKSSNNNSTDVNFTTTNYNNGNLDNASDYYRKVLTRPVYTLGEANNSASSFNLDDYKIKVEDIDKQ